MRRRYALLSVALLYMGSACMQDPEAPHNQPDTPTLSVDETSVTRVSMLVNGSFGHDLTDITSYGVELSTTLFESGGEVQTLTPQEVGPDGYALGVSGLSPNETYYLRAFISNGHSKMYSSVITQKTPETSVASVSDVTLSADGTYMTATLEDNGGRSVEEVGFVWGSTNDRRSLRREKRYPATLSDDGKSFKLPVSYIGKGTHYVLAYAEDNKEATGFSRIAYEHVVDDGRQPANEIWYTSTDGNVIELDSRATSFGTDVSLVSNTYENGRGVMTFSGPVTEISKWSFYASTRLQSILLPESVVSIGGYSFTRTAIETIHIPQNVTSIAEGCFSICENLASFTGKYASSDGKSLIVDGTMVAFAPADKPAELTIDSSVKDIGYAVFSFCSFLTQIHFPDELEQIKHQAFERCVGLTHVEFPSSLKNIERLAFEDCENLTSLAFPESDFTVERDAFSQCLKLSSLTGNYVRQDGRSMIIDNTLVCVALDGLEEYVVPDGVTSTCALHWMKDLKKLVYPETITQMGQIWDCKSLQSITVKATTPPSFSFVFTTTDHPNEFYNTNDCPIYVPAEAVEAYKSAKGWSTYADRIQAIPSDWKPNHYLTFTSEGTTKLSLTNHYNNAPVLYYSTDETNWAEWDYSELTFSSDAPVYICGDNPDGFNIDINTYSSFSSAGDPFSVSGDIMSLINNQESVTVIPKEGCFRGLFFGTNIVSPPSLPATTLAYGCYYQMFYACPNLATAPELPATTMAVGCYWEMFSGCTSLTTPPALPATSMEGGCYRDMFYGCSSLKTAPELPATKLASNCYNAMFYGCSSLTSPPDLPATIMEKGCYANMFYGCSSLASAPDLPSTSLAEDCYASMFSGCSLLTSAPSVLPATTLAPRCYSDMFYYCINLPKAPEIAATTMAEYSCRRMFQNCSQLTEASELPVAVLAEGCYQEMFFLCERLSHVQCLATDIGASSCVNQWLVGVASTGTFVKAPGMHDWPSGGSGIPEGWTVLNEDGTAPIAPSKYLTFTSEGTTKLSLSNQGYAPVLYYSFDTTSWTQWDYGELSFAADKPLYICGDNANGLCPYSNVYTVNVFTASGDLFAVSGDIMSLLNKDEDMTAIPGNPGSSAITSCFYGLFRDCTILTSGPSLPALQLTPLCYSYMFSGCTALKVAPELPATIISTRCYDHMFEGCSALTEAPALSANTLAPGCYANMFQDCTGLSSAPELPATTLTGYCYDNMFQGCTRLTAAPVLPATAIDMYSYRGMFSGCTSLVTPPELPATSFKSFECYEEMFKGCTSLATAPALPVTELTNGCYANMFKDCTSLRTAPELPAEVLVRNCYYGMFENCSKLNYVKCLVKEVNDSANLNRWLYGVASSGTFVKSAQASNWPAGSSGIPEGWAVVNDGDTPSGGNEGTGEEDWN